MGAYAGKIEFNRPRIDPTPQALSKDRHPEKVCINQSTNGLAGALRVMKQMGFAITGVELLTKRPHKREFLDKMGLMIPWIEQLALIAPHAPAGKTG